MRVRHGGRGKSFCCRRRATCSRTQPTRCRSHRAR